MVALKIVLCSILLTSDWVTLMICSSTRPMRTSTKTISKQCSNTYRNLSSNARLESANSEFGKSAFSDRLSIQMESAWSQAACLRLKTGRCWNAFEMPKCYLDLQTTPAKYKSVRKQHAIVTDTPGDLTSASKHFLMLPDPPGVKQSALRLCKIILRCF